MKRVIIGLGAIAVVAAIVVGVTRAYFADVETSQGNIFQVGKLNLKVDNHCYYNGAECICAQSGEHAGECYWDIGGNGQFGDGEVSEDNRCFCTWSEKDLSDNDLFFDFNDVKPGDFGEDTVSLHIINNDAWLCAQLDNLANDDNGCEDPESKIDTTCGAGEGELADNLFFTVWQDDDCDNVLDAGEEVLVDSQPASEGLWPLADSTTGEPVAGDSTVCYGIKWEVPLSTTNIIQSDSLSGDITFTAVQARHMDSFQCSDLTNGGTGGMECIQDSDCDDGNDCTADVCSDGVCQHNCQVGIACDDGNTDTVMDKCQLIDDECQCAGTAAECITDADCDDGDVCTVDVCENYQCAHHPQTGNTCDDGDADTSDDICINGQCTGRRNYYYDHDHDGYGTDDFQNLYQPNGYYTATQSDDCDDNNSSIYPNAPEICDNKDNDCDGNVDEGLPTHTYYRDRDNDNFGDPQNSITSCFNYPPGGYSIMATDCNDNNPDIHPGAIETCNNIDDDCDGQVDETFHNQGLPCQVGNSWNYYYCCNGVVQCGPCQ